MLEKVGFYNDLSPALRKKLEDRIASFGKNVRYKFNISNQNPDPEKKSGDVIWPFLWTLKPVTFNIMDKDENREDKQKVKKIGIVTGTNEKGEPNAFRRVRVHEREKGVLTLSTENIEDLDSIAYIELCPKLSGGDFADKDKRAVVTRIDEQAAATQARIDRSAKKKASDFAEKMSDKEVIEFADAMSWDSSQEIEILRNDVEVLAETTPLFFNELVESKNLEYQATIKQAMNKGIISFDPAEYRFIWTSTTQPIATLQPIGEKNEVQKLSDFFQTGDAKAQAVYKKIKTLITEKPIVTA